MPDLKASTSLQIPDWWKKLTQPKRDNYLQLHPRSKYQKIRQAEIQERLANNPEERSKLRSVIKKISKIPREIKNSISKISNFNPDKLSKKHEDEIKKSVEEAGKKGSHSKIMSAVTTSLLVAGTLTIGAGLLATGGLPYAILTARLVTDTYQLTREIYQKIKEGEGVAKSVFSSVGNTVTRALQDPKVIAASLMLMNKKKKETDEKPKEKPPANQNKKEPKVQSAPKKTEKKDIKPKVKPKISLKAA